MPEVVKSRIVSQNIEEVETIQQNILNAYLMDFSKYTDNSLSKKINKIWDSIPEQFAKENDKFVW
jgi:hypothetical protein